MKHWSCLIRWSWGASCGVNLEKSGVFGLSGALPSPRLSGHQPKRLGLRHTNRPQSLKVLRHTNHNKTSLKLYYNYKIVFIHENLIAVLNPTLVVGLWEDHKPLYRFCKSFIFSPIIKIKFFLSWKKFSSRRPVSIFFNHCWRYKF